MILPPTYAGFHALCPTVESWVNAILDPLGYRAMNTLSVPIKPLAVHSGLAKYGKNNITYVDGMGSFHHLFAFYSDVPCEPDAWHEMKMLERCAACRACVGWAEQDVAVAGSPSCTSESRKDGGWK